MTNLKKDDWLRAKTEAEQMAKSAEITLMIAMSNLAFIESQLKKFK